MTISFGKAEAPYDEAPALDCRFSVPPINILLVSAISFLLATGVGASYVYVDLSLNRMGASATEIGINAAMPPLAWLLATPLMPQALRRFRPKLLLLSLLATAVPAAIGFPLLPEREAWLVLRFLFGGCCGMAFRLIEYWISTASPETHRARNVGIYAAFFCAGAALGAAILPVVGLDGWPPILLIVAFVIGAAILLAANPHEPPAVAHSTGRAGMFKLLAGPAAVAMIGCIIFGMFEPVPYTLMPVYLVRSGLDNQWAGLSGSAFLLGQVIFLMPIGIAADRYGKTRCLALCATTALTFPFFLPQTLVLPELMLGSMFVWGAVAGGLYTVSLAMLADNFSGDDLAAANATFGTLYAAGGLVGPLVHGLAMDWRDPQGLMLSAAALFVVFLVFIGWNKGRGRGRECRAS